MSIATDSRSFTLGPCTMIGGDLLGDNRGASFGQPGAPQADGNTGLLGVMSNTVGTPCSRRPSFRCSLFQRSP